MVNTKRFFPIGLVLLSACSSLPVDLPVSSGHPAHSDAPQAPFAAQPDELGPDAFLSLESTEPPEAKGPALPGGAVQDRKQVLEAYFQIGDLLAGDTYEAAKAAAGQIDVAVAALVGQNHPDDPHFWHQHSTQVQTIRQQAEAFGDAKELKAARITYEPLGNALKRLVEEIGVPAAFDKPVF